MRIKNVSKVVGKSAWGASSLGLGWVGLHGEGVSAGRRLLPSSFRKSPLD